MDDYFEPVSHGLLYVETGGHLISAIMFLGLVFEFEPPNLQAGFLCYQHSHRLLSVDLPWI